MLHFWGLDNYTSNFPPKLYSCHWITDFSSSEGHDCHDDSRPSQHGPYRHTESNRLEEWRHFPQSLQLRCFSQDLEEHSGNAYRHPWGYFVNCKLLLFNSLSSTSSNEVTPASPSASCWQAWGEISLQLRRSIRLRFGQCWSSNRHWSVIRWQPERSRLKVNY